jgi:hypothetical protein
MKQRFFPTSSVILFTAAGLALAGGLALSAARAQPTGGALATARTPAAFDVNSFLSRQIERVALMDLRQAASPQAEDYGVATLLCEIADRYAPGNVELARRRAEAAWNWGDAAHVEQATRRIIELDRRDTMGQLRLLSSRFASLQTAEGKIAAYDRVGESKELDASIRSRFLLDSALLARERGDEEGFVQRLSRAIELDATNKDASVLALAYFEERSDDPWGRLDLATNLLLADPLDPLVHARLAKELAAGGAYHSARRFIRNIAELLRQGGQQPSPDSVLESNVLDILCDGPQKTYGDLNSLISTSRESIASQLRALEQAKQPTAGLIKPEDWRLDMDREGLRILCALMLDDTAGASSAVRDLGLTAHANVKRLQDPLQRPRSMTEADAREYARIGGGVCRRGDTRRRVRGTRDGRCSRRRACQGSRTPGGRGAE